MTRICKIYDKPSGNIPLCAIMEKKLGGVIVEMTNKQFAMYLANDLRELERIQKELQQQGVQNKDLDKMIRRLQDQLKRP